MQSAIHQNWFFPQPPEEVWDYLTKPELLEQWLGPSDFQPVVGHKFRFTSPYGNHSWCEVLEVLPCRRLVYTWQKNSARGDKPFTSTVTWTLTARDNGTELQLLHDGFSVAEDMEAHKKGWNICREQLAARLATITQ
ncbi:MAG TPA: SRPBCC domain-containing protein [Puia sp.]|nr:SRPBCC domain-containing protein [Puia sp.]